MSDLDEYRDEIDTLILRVQGGEDLAKLDLRLVLGRLASAADTQGIEEFGMLGELVLKILTTLTAGQELTSREQVTMALARAMVRIADDARRKAMI